MAAEEGCTALRQRAESAEQDAERLRAQLRVAFAAESAARSSVAMEVQRWVDEYRRKAKAEAAELEAKFRFACEKLEQATADRDLFQADAAALRAVVSELETRPAVREAAQQAVAPEATEQAVQVPDEPPGTEGWAMGSCEDLLVQMRAELQQAQAAARHWQQEAAAARRRTESHQSVALRAGKQVAELERLLRASEQQRRLHRDRGDRFEKVSVELRAALADAETRLSQRERVHDACYSELLESYEDARRQAADLQQRLRGEAERCERTGQAAAAAEAALAEERRALAAERERSDNMRQQLTCALAQLQYGTTELAVSRAAAGSATAEAAEMRGRVAELRAHLDCTQRERCRAEIELREALHRAQPPPVEWPPRIMPPPSRGASPPAQGGESPSQLCHAATRWGEIDSPRAECASPPVPHAATSQPAAAATEHQPQQRAASPQCSPPLPTQCRGQGSAAAAVTARRETEPRPAAPELSSGPAVSASPACPRAGASTPRPAAAVGSARREVEQCRRQLEQLTLEQAIHSGEALLRVAVTYPGRQSDDAAQLLAVPRAALLGFEDFRRLVLGRFGDDGADCELTYRDQGADIDLEDDASLREFVDAALRCSDGSSSTALPVLTVTLLPASSRD